MLERIKNYVEKRVNRQVSMQELQAALKSAQNNIMCNYLMCNADVSVSTFLDILVQCINFNYRYNTNTNTDSVITIIDQAGQTKRIVGVTIMDYNRNTVFGIGLDGKKLWLGKYNTEQEAENIKNIIDTYLTEKRRCDLRYLNERTGDA